MKILQYIAVIVCMYGIGVQAHARTWTLEDINIHGRQTRQYIEKKGYTPETPLETLIQDESDRFRATIYTEIGVLIRKSDDFAVQRELTELYTRGLGDDRTEDFVLRNLSKPPFEKDYFNDQARENILSMGLKGSDKSDYIRALGKAGIEDPTIDLAQLAKQQEIFENADPRVHDIFESMGQKDMITYRSTFWAALLVQARQDNPEAIDRILTEIREQDWNWLFADGRGQLVEDLGYIRQAEAVDILVELLFTEIPAKGMFSGSDHIPSSVAEYASQGLARSLEGFPIDYWQLHSGLGIEPTREYIRNYEGPWRIIGKPLPEVPEVEPVVEVIETPVVADVAAEEPTPEAVEPEPIKAPVEQSSKWWLWLIGLLVVAGGVGLATRRND